MTDSSERPQRFWQRRRFLAGLVAGIVLVLLVRGLLEQTPLSDWFVTPLLRPNTTAPADVIVVLGAGMTDLCTPNYNGLQRVLLAVDLYDRRLASTVLFTGGQPAGFSCTIAESMAAVAERLGVPREHIRTENSSMSTWQNALRSDAILKSLGARSVLLVTDRVHLARGEACFRRFGYVIERAGVPIPLGHTSNTNLLFMGAREYLAWAYYWMRGHVDPALAEGADVEPPRAVERMRSDTPVMTSDPNRRPTEATVIILGASYAAGWNPTLERMAFTNSGVGGQQSFEMLARFSKDVVDRKPRAVILWGFINDVFRAPRAESAAALARVRESYITMLAEARRHGIAPILATEVTVGVRAGLRETLAGFVGRLLGKQSYDEYVNRHVMDTNAWLRELARREGVLLLDFERVLAGRGGRRRAEYTASDGSHITAPAYDALTAYAKSILPGQLAEHAGTLPSGGQQDPLRP